MSNHKTLAEGFHGRPARTRTDYTATVKVRNKLADLAKVVSLEVFGKGTIMFWDVKSKGMPPSGTKLPTMAAANKHQLVLVSSGIDCSKLDWLSESELEKDLVYLGKLRAIGYVSDKHHLGDGSEDGGWYRHAFGDAGGEKPHLVYDRLNGQLLLVGGDYVIEPEGIDN